MGKLILVIDDSLTIRTVVEVGLRREGYEVVCCESGETALYWLASREARIPDLILVDLHLPQMDGYSVIRCLRSQPVFKLIPVVVISRRDGITDLLKGRLVGANGYLVKPFTTEELILVVSNYLRGLRLVRAL